MADVSVVIGLGFGDEGKGTTVDFLTREKNAKLVVRFNGGAQAGHNVRGPDWTHHCFSQWGAGTLAGARTHLSRFMMVNPVFAFAEAKHLGEVGVKNPWSLMTVEEDALLTTPFQVAVNRLKELARGAGRHGSCGMGIGETMNDSLEGLAIHARDLRDWKQVHDKLLWILRQKREQVKSIPLEGVAADDLQREMSVFTSECLEQTVSMFRAFADVQIVDRLWLRKELDAPGHVIFEGAQGVLLDEWCGFHPNTTWSTCTFDNAVSLISNAGNVGEVDYLGVLRTYATRHGAGVFPTESDAFKSFIKHDHNVPTPWQESMRAGALDFVLAKYAIEVANRTTGLVLTHMDSNDADRKTQVCTAYRMTDKAMPFYHFQGHWPVATDIKIGNGHDDLERQESIGKALATVQPLYETIQQGELPSLVSEMLGVPIEIISNGPRAVDKERIQ